MLESIYACIAAIDAIPTHVHSCRRQVVAEAQVPFRATLPGGSRIQANGNAHRPPFPQRKTARPGPSRQAPAPDSNPQPPAPSTQHPSCRPQQTKRRVAFLGGLTCPLWHFNMRKGADHRVRGDEGIGGGTARDVKGSTSVLLLEPGSAAVPECSSCLVARQILVPNAQQLVGPQAPPSLGLLQWGPFSPFGNLREAWCVPV